MKENKIFWLRLEQEDLRFVSTRVSSEKIIQIFSCVNQSGKSSDGGLVPVGRRKRENIAAETLIVNVAHNVSWVSKQEERRTFFASWKQTLRL